MLLCDADLSPEAARSLTSADRVMWITPQRVFYAGLLGAPALHTKGALAVYVAVEGLLRVRLDGGEWETAEVVVIPPYHPFEIACQGRHVLTILIELETVDLRRLPEMLHACGAIDAQQFAENVRRVHSGLVAAGGTAHRFAQDFDILFFGAPLPARQLDPRIVKALETIRRDLSGQAAAQACAAQAHLSFSRFLHLFKEETGASFRSVRTWKRARSLLQHVNRDDSLVYVALDIGYPDSTHFSHSIRRFYGLKPRDIFAGSRKLKIFDEEQASQHNAVAGSLNACLQ